MSEESRKKLVARRGAYRSQVSKLLKDVLDGMAQASPVQLELWRTKAEALQETLVGLDSNMEEYLEEGAIIKEIDDVMVYKDKILRIVAEIKNCKEVHQADASRDSVNVPAASSIKLPKLEIPQFSGAPTLWFAFFEVFERSVHKNASLSDAEKFQYLKGHLQGEALASIAGLQVTGIMYSTALDILKRRFGDKTLVVKEHYRKLLALPAVKASNDRNGLRKLVDEVHVHSRALEALGIAKETFIAVTVENVMQALPVGMRTDYYRGNPHSSNQATSQAKDDLATLLEYLENEILSMVKAGSSSADYIRAKSLSERYAKPYKSNKGNIPSAASLHTSQQSSCYFCGKNHKTEVCRAPISLDEKKDKLKKQHRCFRCTEVGHTARGCCTETICEKCKKKHATTMCNPTRQSSTWRIGAPEKNETKEVTVSATDVNSVDILLQTAQVNVIGNLETTRVRALFDTGSQVTLITEDIVKSLNIPVIGSRLVNISAVGSRSAKPQSVKVVNVKLQSSYDSNVYIIEALVVPFITQSVLPKLDPATIPNSKFLRYKLAEVFQIPGGEKTLLSILLGCDTMLPLLKGRMERISDTNLIAVDTVFGWTFYGPIPKNHVGPEDHPTTSNSFFCSGQGDLQDLVKRFWHLESIGILPEEYDSLKDMANEQFKEGVKRLPDGQYEVPLIWNTFNTKELCDNKAVALSRLKTLTKKLSKDMKVFDQYYDHINMYVSEGFAEVIPKEEVDSPCLKYYMPHRAVLREESTSTKVRIVFDCSASGKGCDSLNDHLYCGENLNPNLLDILINFRTYKVGLTGDVEKAFLQVSLQDRDRDVVRYLWYERRPEYAEEVPPIQEYRMTVIPFGTTCSPYLLSATLRHHADQFIESDSELKETAELIKKCTYVDDLVFGADDEEDAEVKYRQTLEIFGLAKMKIRKWVSNSGRLNESFVEDGVAADPKSNLSKSNLFKVLGLKWDNVADSLLFDFKHLSPDYVETKRQVLQVMAQLYDPLGLLIPFTVRAKILFQDLWQLEVDWDQPVPEEFKRKFQAWCSEISLLDRLRLPRCYNLDFDVNKHIQVHVFADASPMAYGACAYLRGETSQGEVFCSLICSRSRVAPMKQQSLPRLELMAGLLATRLSVHLKMNFRLPIEKITIWSDSEIVLAWVRNEPKLRKPFVANRIIEIQKESDKDSWRYCPGDCNPADLMTRGLTTIQLQSSLAWWTGPKWLKEEEMMWPVAPVTNIDLANVQQENRSGVFLSIAGGEENQVLPLNRISNYYKLLRIVAFVNRFIKGCTKQGRPKDLKVTLEEVNEAESICAKNSQVSYFSNEYNDLKAGKPLEKNSPLFEFQPYLDSNDCLRMKGRLQFLKTSNSYERSPILLPSKSKFTELLVRETHNRLKHAGVAQTLISVREKFWILRGRQVVKKVLSRCVKCDKVSCKSATQSEAPLPSERINDAVPFDVCGIDFAGPLITRQNKKVYIALWTCATTRAVHLETVSGLTSQQFLMAFNRFVARRGLPTVIITDNAATFKRTSKDFEKLWKNINSVEVNSSMVKLRIKWIFITPRAPWWGGFWERMVRTVKNTLKKTLGNSSLDFEELSTILCQIESVINDRPITYTYNDANEPESLTPSMIMIGKRYTSLPNSTYNFDAAQTTASQQELQKRYRYRKKLFKNYCNRWYKEYLLNLRGAHHSKPIKNSVVCPGEVMLLQEDNIPKHLWKLVTILEVNKGRDGLVRSCLVRTSGGSILRRPIQCLYILESLKREE